MEYVNRVYGTAYEVGQRVRVNGQDGVIVPRPPGIGEHYIVVDFGRHKAPCHPTWEVELLERSTPGHHEHSGLLPKGFPTDLDSMEHT